jgi:glycosyl transferase family 25
MKFAVATNALALSHPAPMPTDVLVINLDRSPDRLAKVDRQLKALSVSYTRISGVDGRFLDPALRTAPLGTERYFRPMENGDYGTYQSHRLCWQRVVDERLDWAIVLEDDAVLSPSFVDVPAAIERLPLEWDVVKLFNGWRKRRTWPLMKAGPFEVVAYDKIPAGTPGYVVSRRGAERLLRGHRRMMRPVDIDMQYWWETRTEVIGFSPFPVRDDAVAVSEAWRFDKQKKARVARMWIALQFWLKNLRSWGHLARQRREWRAASR